MKFAYFITPHIGGTYTVYTSVRTGLARYGIDVRWLGVGPGAQAVLEDARWAREYPNGSVAGGETTDDRAQAEALIDYLEEENYDGVFVNAACNRVHSNVIRYLPSQIRRIMTVHTITVATYAGARALRDHVHAIICVSPRIRDDLVRRHGFSAADTRVIPNALDLTPYSGPATPQVTSADAPLRLLSLGRLIDSDKGVFWLPGIMQQLRDLPVQLTIAGDGPDRAELERRCAPLGDRVRFLGRIPPDQVPGVLCEHDVFLFPSRFEGLPLSLVEAMSAGCVPVASRIKGVTDFVVTHGSDGLLFDLGNVRQAASCVRQLAQSRSQLARLSAAARENVVGRFELGAMAQGYHEVVQSVMAAPREIRPPLPITQWTYPRELRKGLRTRLPPGLKKRLRMLRERLA
jgi:glycosyltransferase involved in cell wall biosynthesis